MKERTVSQRNFVGAFLGGVMGILGFGYLHPVALPFGCFLGVVIGWWYREIATIAVDSFRRGVTAENFRGTSCTMSSWLGEQTAVFAQWVSERHRTMNKARLVRRFTMAIYLAINALWAIPALVYCVTVVSSPSPKVMMTVSFLIGGAFIFVAHAIPLFSYLEASKMNMREYHTFKSGFRSEKGGRVARGSFRLFVNDLTELFVSAIIVFVFLVCASVWFIGFGVSVFLPVAIVVGIVKGVHNVSMKAGYRLSLGTTIITTALTAWMIGPHLHDLHILWGAALLAGIMSAVATECVRRLIVHHSVGVLLSSMPQIGEVFGDLTISFADSFDRAQRRI